MNETPNADMARPEGEPPAKLDGDDGQPPAKPDGENNRKNIYEDCMKDLTLRNIDL